MRILTHPNPVLKDTARVVDPTRDLELRGLVAQMARTMYAAPGVGLAAPQVGIQKRVIVFDVDDKLFALCNPAIIDASEDTQVNEEGCLSLPELVVDIERPARVTCEALDLDGATVRIDADGMLARVLQHEIDHLDGVLIIDRAEPEQRKAALRLYLSLGQTG